MRVSQITKHSGWAQYKTTSASEVALVGSAGQLKKANIPSNAFVIPEAMNNVEMRFRCNTVDQVGTAHIYAARLDDDACHIGDVTLTQGTQLATGGMFYIDTMVLTDRWTTEVKLADANGNNGMARLTFDASGYDVVFVLIEWSSGDPTYIIDISGF